PGAGKAHRADRALHRHGAQTTWRRRRHRRHASVHDHARRAQARCVDDHESDARHVPRRCAHALRVSALRGYTQREVEGTIVENPALAQGRRRAALAFIFVTLLIDILAFGLIIPVLPHLILGFVGGDDALAAQWYMCFSVAFFAMQFVFTPIQGALADWL